MQLEVTFKNLKPRDEIRRRGDHLYKKLHRFLDTAAQGKLSVGVEHGKAVVELVVSTRGQTFKSTSEDDELKPALDQLFHEMENRLRRAKERRVGRRHEGLPEVADSVEEDDDDDSEGPAA
jgi:ribosomal subunit interface protein